MSMRLLKWNQKARGHFCVFEKKALSNVEVKTKTKWMFSLIKELRIRATGKEMRGNGFITAIRRIKNIDISFNKKWIFVEYLGIKM